VAAEQETTALGAAALAAGTAVRVGVAKRYEPEADPADVAGQRERWAVALRRASSSVPE
jgi:hypothetical protein